MGLYDDFAARLGLGSPEGPAPSAPVPSSVGGGFASALGAAGLPTSMPDVSMPAMPSSSALGGVARRFGEGLPGPFGMGLAALRIGDTAANAAARTEWGKAHPSAVDAMRLLPGGTAPAGPVAPAGPPEVTLTPGQAPVAALPSVPSLANLGLAGATRPMGYGGGGGGGNPFGGLAGAVNADNAEMLGTYGTQAGQTTEKGRLEAKALSDKANIENVTAARADREAQIRQEEDAVHFARMDDWQRKSAEKVEQLGAMQVDPKRLFANADAGDRFNLMLGGAIGGVLVGTGAQSSNAFIDGVNKQIAQDIAAQEKAIDVKDRELGHRNTLLGQFEKLHGDRSLAQKQTQDAMLAATRNQLQSQADSENLPASARNNAALMVTGIDRERVGLKTAIDKQALAAAQAQAAAAAAARAAAEKRAWDRSIQVAELGLKRDELEIKAMAEGPGGKAAREDARHISTQLVDKGIPQASTAAQIALEATNKSPRSALERFARTVAPEASNSLYGNEANLREQAYKNFTNAAMKVQMGNVTAGEELRANIQFAADPKNSDEMRKGAVKNALRMLQEAEKDIKGGSSEAGQAQFDRQRAAANVKGAVAGDGAPSFRPTGTP